MKSLTERDFDAVWHPATHFCDASVTPNWVIERAAGAWLYPSEHPPILDAISSWWTSIHGHGCTALVDALYQQAQRLDHVMFAGFTHRPAIEFAEALLDAAPAGYEKVFYSDCGSASIEIALKLAFQYHVQSGQPHRRRFCALENSYHGETLGALSVCGHDDYRALFSPLMPSTVYLPSPENPTLIHLADGPAPDLSAEEREALQQSELIFEREGETIAALIIEPLVQCAGRFRMHSPAYLKALAQLADRYNILLIADEIAVGFGRCGDIFASARAEIRPDFLCLSKGLSGGMLPLACTLIGPGIFDAFTASPDKTFLHSHTYCGNPMLCAIGLKSLELLQRAASENILTDLSRRLFDLATQLSDEPYIRGFRQTGNIVAFDLCTDGIERPGRDIRAAALQHGILLRPLHDVLYWMPPIALKPEEDAELLSRTVQSLRSVFGKSADSTI